MKLLSLKCPSCNATIEVNSKVKQFTCNYCGTTTIIDDEVIVVKNITSKLQSIINELKEDYDNGNLKEGYKLAWDSINVYPKNKEIKEYYKKIAIELVESYEKDNPYQAMCISCDLMDIFKNDNQMKNLRKKSSINYFKNLQPFKIEWDDGEWINDLSLDEFSNVISRYIVYHAEDLYKLYLEYPDDKEIKELYLSYKEAFILYMNEQVNNCNDYYDFRSSSTIEDCIVEAFPNDKEVMEYFEKYKVKEEDLRKKEFSQSMDEKKPVSKKAWFYLAGFMGLPGALFGVLLDSSIPLGWVMLVVFILCIIIGSMIDS